MWQLDASWSQLYEHNSEEGDSIVSIFICLFVLIGLCMWCMLYWIVRVEQLRLHFAMLFQWAWWVLLNEDLQSIPLNLVQKHSWSLKVRTKKVLILNHYIEGWQFLNYDYELRKILIYVGFVCHNFEIVIFVWFVFFVTRWFEFLIFIYWMIRIPLDVWIIVEFIS